MGTPSARATPADEGGGGQLDPGFEVAVDHLPLGSPEQLVGEPELDSAHLVQAGQLCGRQLQLQGAEGVLELLGLTDPQDRDDPPGADPGHGHLGRGRAEAVGDPVDLTGDGQVALGEAGLVGGGPAAVVGERRGAGGVLAGEDAGAQPQTDRPNASATGSSSRSAVAALSEVA
jgi:hypothetical protein